MDIALVYMVAGMSSRFGGIPKQLAKVGPNDETLIEISLNQAIGAGFTKIVFIVGEKTEEPFKELFKDSYKGIPVFYAKQTFDVNTRDKPFGTVDAVLSAKNILDEPFVVANGDDLYGRDAFLQLVSLAKKGSFNATVGYLLKDSLPENGTVNRGIFSEQDGFVTTIVEELHISKDNVVDRNLTMHSLCNMNIFLLQKNVLTLLEKQFSLFKEEHKDSRTAECLLPVELSNLIVSNAVTLVLLKSSEKCLGITNPEDAAILRDILSS